MLTLAVGSGAPPWCPPDVWSQGGIPWSLKFPLWHVPCSRVTPYGQHYKPGTGLTLTASNGAPVVRDPLGDIPLMQAVHPRPQALRWTGPSPGSLGFLPLKGTQGAPRCCVSWKF